MPRSFLGLFVLVTTAATAAVLLIAAGLRDGSPLPLATGALLAIMAALGIAALARIIVASERQARRR